MTISTEEAIAMERDKQDDKRLTEYRPEDCEERYRWRGDGPPPAKWWAGDGTLVYRSYADYCDD